MAVDLIATGVLNGHTVRGLLLNHTVSDTPTGFTWYDEFDNTVTVGASDRLRIHTLTGSTSTSGGEQVKLVTSNERQVVRLYLGTNRASFHDFSSAPLLMPPGSSLFAVTDVWSPSDLGGLYGWWDFSDDTDLTLTGSEITAAADLSGNSRPLTKTATGISTGPANTGSIGGVQAAAFSAGGPLGMDYPSNELDAGVLVWVFSVHEVMASGTNDIVVSTRDDAGSAWFVGNRATTRLGYGLVGPSGGIEEHVVTAGDPVVRSNRFDQRVSGGNLTAASESIAQSWVNGGDFKHDTYTTPAAYSTTNSKLGVGGNPNDGAQITCDIGEIVVITGDLTTEERQKMEGYLAHKWGQEGSLPGDHPYKAAAP